MKSSHGDVNLTRNKLQPNQRQALDESRDLANESSSSFRLAKYNKTTEGGAFTDHFQCCDAICCIGSILLKLSSSSLTAAEIETGDKSCNLSQRWFKISDYYVQMLFSRSDCLRGGIYKLQFLFHIIRRPHGFNSCRRNFRR